MPDINDIYDNEKKLLRQIEKLKKDTSISEGKKKTILAFIDNCYAEGLSKARILRYSYDMKNIAIWLPMEFEEATIDDIKSLVGQIERMNYAHQTKYGIRVALKKFYKWLRKSEDTYPPEVRWMKNNNKIDRRKLPEDMLTEDDVKKLIEAAYEPRDKAFISMLYESGCRIGEMMTIRIKSLKFDKYGAQIVVNGKTGYRQVRLILSVPFLQDYLNKHPRKNDPMGQLWVSKDGTPVTYTRMKAMVSETGMKAGITKRTNPHSFRHARATYLANHLSEMQLKSIFGWAPDSRMASIYVHLSGKDTDNALLRVYGLEEKEKHEESELKPKICKCGQVNASTNNFCSKCGNILTEKVEELITKEQDFLKLLTPDIIEKLIEKKVQDLLAKDKKKKSTE